MERRSIWEPMNQVVVLHSRNWIDWRGMRKWRTIGKDCHWLSCRVGCHSIACWRFATLPHAESALIYLWPTCNDNVRHDTIFFIFTDKFTHLPHIYTIIYIYVFVHIFIWMYIFCASKQLWVLNKINWKSYHPFFSFFFKRNKNTAVNKMKFIHWLCSIHDFEKNRKLYDRTLWYCISSQYTVHCASGFILIIVFFLFHLNTTKLWIYWRYFWRDALFLGNYFYG